MDTETKIKVIVASVWLAFILTYAYVMHINEQKYISLASIEPSIDIENATLYVAPLSDGKINVTLVLVMRNSGYPVKVLAVLADLGDVCDVGIIFSNYRRCFTKLDVSPTIVAGNITVTIVAHKAYDKGVTVSGFTPIEIHVTRADVEPPNEKPYIHVIRVLADVIFSK